MVIGPGNHLDRACRCDLANRNASTQTRPCPADLSRDSGHGEGVVSVSPAAGDLVPQVVGIHPGQLTDEAPDVMAAALLPVGHDVHARLFLVGDGQAYGIVLSL